MAFCSSCGQPVSEQDKFCAKCGKPVPTGGLPAENSASGGEQAQELTAGKAGSFRSSIGRYTLFGLIGLAVIFGGVTTVLWQNAEGKLSDAAQEIESLKNDNSGLTTQVQNLSSQVSTVNARLAQAESELSALQAVYPLKNFASYGDLQNWLFNAITKLDPADDYPEQYYMLQRLAMEDGYFLSVAIWEDESYYYLELYAVAGDIVYICFEDGSIYTSFYLN